MLPKNDSTGSHTYFSEVASGLCEVARIVPPSTYAGKCCIFCMLLSESYCLGKALPSPQAGIMPAFHKPPRCVCTIFSCHWRVSGAADDKQTTTTTTTKKAGHKPSKGLPRALGPSRTGFHKRHTKYTRDVWSVLGFTLSSSSAGTKVITHLIWTRKLYHSWISFRSNMGIWHQCFFFSINERFLVHLG